MSKVKKYFGGFNITWLRVIVFAVITAVYTALINQVPFLEDTSFRDIAAYLECWILFAVFIIVNCKKWWEASLKCFVFFLISQPLIYLIEVPFLGWGIFGYYGYWFLITLLTLPGAAIAFTVKKKNWLSVIVLSVATAFLSYSGVMYFTFASTDFPHHLLSGIFCIALAVFFVFVLLDEKKHRAAALGVIIAVFIAASAIAIVKGRPKDIILGGGEWTFTMDDDSVADVEMVGEDRAKVRAKHNGNATVIFKNSDGDEESYLITVIGGESLINRIDDE